MKVRSPRAFPALAFALLLAGLPGCTLLTGGYHECNQSSDCPGGRSCVQNFCVSVNCQTVFGSDAGNAIAFGAPLPLSNSSGPDQEQLIDLDAFLLGLDEINQQYVGNRPIVVYGCDTANDPVQLQNELNYLISNKHVAAVLISHSSQVLSALPITVPAGVMVMSATATSPALTSASASALLPDGGSIRLLWRTAPSDVLQAQVMANQILNDPLDAGYLRNITNVGIIYQDDPYGQGLAISLEGDLGTAKNVNSFQYPGGADAGVLSNVLAQLNTFHPDLTVAIGFPSDLVNIITLASQEPNLSAAAGNRWFFTDSAKDPSLFGNGGLVASQINGAFGTAPAQGAGTAYATFAQRFQTQYNLNPSNTSFTAHSYDAMYLMALAAASAVGPGPNFSGPVTGMTMAEGMRLVSSGTTAYSVGPVDFLGAAGQLEKRQPIAISGASGPLQFNPATGDTPGPIEVWSVSGTTFNTLQIVP